MSAAGANARWADRPGAPISPLTVIATIPLSGSEALRISRGASGSREFVELKLGVGNARVPFVPGRRGMRLPAACLPELIAALNQLSTTKEMTNG